MEKKVFNISKYQGAGNDFIIFDNRKNDLPHLSENTIKKMCHRRFGIGADGFIILQNKEGYDFKMDFFNSDGKPGSMCGNGGRCIVAFAHDIGIIKNSTKFLAPDGEHLAKFYSHNKVLLKMSDLSEFKINEHGYLMNTGSPHLVVNLKNIENINYYNEGFKLRHHLNYSPDGTNVNFIEITEYGFDINTFERGVENLTYSCGTGTVAAAITVNQLTQKNSPILAKAKGGDLIVHFKNKNKSYTDIWLEGPALKIFKGIYFL